MAVLAVQKIIKKYGVGLGKFLRGYCNPAEYFYFCVYNNVVI